jgi:hypothetical protein
MTPKILKAGLLVGALVFALVGCGQNTKPTVNLKASYTFAPDERTKRFKISDVIKDKDSDSLTLSNFTSNNQAAWITLDKTSNPTSIILNAATLDPRVGDQTAKVSFEVSDGTDKITVSMNVTVEAPDLGCMIQGGAAIVPNLCPLGSVYKPYEIKPPETGDIVLVKFSAFPSFSKYRVHDADDIPHFQNPVTVGGARYIANTAVTQVDCDVAVDFDGDGTVANDEGCFQITLPDPRIATPDGVTVMLELHAWGKDGEADADDIKDIVHLIVVVDE